MRYTRQRHNFDCGPTAFVNILKWAGIPVSYRKDQDTVHSLLECGPHTPAWQKRVWGKNARGARPAWLKVMLMRYSQETERFRVLWEVDNIKINNIRHHLRQGQVVLLTYQWKHKQEGKKPRYGSHYMLVIGMAGSGFYVVNDARRGPALQLYSSRYFRSRVYSYTKDSYYPTALIITRNLP